MKPFEQPIVVPGEVLKTKFMDPLGITQIDLADRLFVERRRINEIVLGKREITPDTALRLTKAFGVSATFWLTLQMKYNLQMVLAKNVDEYERVQAIRTF